MEIYLSLFFFYATLIMRQNIYRFLFNYKHLVAEQMCGEKTYNDTNHRHYIP